MLSSDENIFKDKIIYKRMISFAIDLSLILIFSKFITYIYIKSISTFMMYLPYSGKTNVSNQIWAVENIIFPIICCAYFTIFFFATNGKTIGCYLKNIKIQSINNDQVSLWESFKRSVGYVFCIEFGLLLLFLPYFLKNQKGLPEWLSKTVVTPNLRNTISNQHEPLFIQFELPLLLSTKKNIHENQNDIFSQKRIENDLLDNYKEAA